MSVIALASAKGSPGVTTLALALWHVWPRRVLLADCDPAGGDIAAGYLAGDVDPGRGLLNLTLAARRSDLRSTLEAHLVALDDAGTRCLLPGLSDPSHAAALTAWWDRLGSLFADLGAADDGSGLPGTDVLVDCGRLGAAHPPTALVRRADLVLVVLRPTLRSVTHAKAALPGLMHGGARAAGADAGRLVAVLVGEGRPYTAREVARALDVPVLTIAQDARAAAVFSDGAPAGRRLATSPLLRGARTLADDLAHRATASTAAGFALSAANGHVPPGGLAGAEEPS